LKAKSKITIGKQIELHREIIEESKDGKRSAQYKLYQLYSKAMYNICYRMMNNREEAEDMLQEAFTDAFRKLSSFRYESTFGAWLKQIVVNKCINEIKRKKADLSFYENMQNFDTQQEEPDVNEQKLSVEKIKIAMKKLPEGSRMIFSLYLLEGYDHVEIAQILDISESTSKSQYMRARRKVKEIINMMNGEGR